MGTYQLFQGHKPNGDVLVMAVYEDELKDAKPEDFFVGGTGPVKPVGEIQIVGDTHWLGDYFSVTD